MDEVIIAELIGGQILIGFKTDYVKPEPGRLYIKNPRVLMVGPDPMTGQVRCGFGPFNPLAIQKREVYGIPEAAVLYTESEKNLEEALVKAYRSAVSGIAIATSNDMSALKI